MAQSEQSVEFDQAVELHRAGRIDEAAAIYQRLIAADPRHAGARHLLGVVASQAGQYEQAVGLIRSSLAIDEAQPAAYLNLGNALMGAGRSGEAEQAYRRSLALSPDLPEGLFGLGNALRETNPDEAMASYRRAVAIRPTFVEALANLARLELAHGQAQAALDHWLAASRHRPSAINLYLGAAQSLAALGRADEAAAIYQGLAEVPSASPDELFEAGNALADLRKHEAAALLYRALLRREPGLVPALNNLGNMLRELGKLDEAETVYRQALASAPDDATIIGNRALILSDLGRIDEAEAECRRALALRPTAVAHSNLGLILMRRGQAAEALDQFSAGRALAPDLADLEFHEGVALLQLGRFAEGWPKYEARWGQQRARERRRDFGRPQWQGEPPNGRTILIHAEQGFGDTIQFIRYAPLLAERGARVVVECQPALARLVAGVTGVDAVVPRGAPLPAYDFHVPMMSLPLAFGTVLETIPAAVPYIAVPDEAAVPWADIPTRYPGLSVGLVWAGDARHYDIESNMTDRRRSVSLDAYAPFFAIPGLRFFSLQIGPAAAQAAGQPALIDLTAQIRDFADTAGLIAQLDLVVSVDTSVAHLAGAMAKPVWVLSRLDNCWRWLTGRRDSPWYPSLRLYRQTAPGDWQPTLQRLAEDLAGWAAAKSG